MIIKFQPIPWNLPFQPFGRLNKWFHLMTSFVCFQFPGLIKFLSRSPLTNRWTKTINWALIQSARLFLSKVFKDSYVRESPSNQDVQSWAEGCDRIKSDVNALRDCIKDICCNFRILETNLTQFHFIINVTLYDITFQLYEIPH